MKLSELFVFRLTTIGNDASVEQCRRLMEESHASAVLVKDGEQPLGAVGRREIARADSDAAHTPVTSIMQPLGSPVHADDMLAPVIAQLKTLATDYLLVTDLEGRPLSLLGIHDLAQQLLHLCIESPQFEQTRRLRWLLDTIPDLVWLKDAYGVYLACNHRFEEFFGAREAEILGKTDYDFVPADLADFFRENDLVALAAGGPSVNEEWVTYANDGHRELLETIKTPLLDENGVAVGVLGIGRDITARKEAEARAKSLTRVYAVLSGINETIVRVRDNQTLFEDACRIAVERGGFLMAWVGRLDAGSGAVMDVAHAGHCGDYLHQQKISLRDDLRGNGPTGRAIREGHHVVCNDIAADPMMAPWRDDALALGYRSVVAFPLMVNGKVAGSFTLYADQESFFNEDELRLLDELASDIGYSMAFSENEKARVESEQLFRGLVEQSMVGVYLIQDGVMRYANPRLARFFGYHPEQILEVPLGELVAASDLQHVQEMIGKRVAGEIQNAHYEFMARRRDGSVFPVEVFGSRVTFNGAPAVIGTLLDITLRRSRNAEMKRLNAEMNALIEGTTDIVFIKDIEGRYVVANHALAERLGRDVDEIIGCTDFDIFPEEQARILRADDRSVIEKGRTRTVEETLDGPQGRITFLSTKGPLLIDGEVKGVFGIVRDINERIEAEQMLRQQKAMLDRVSSLAKVGGWQFDVATMAGSWTEETARIHELDPAVQVDVAQGVNVYQGESRRKIEEAIKAAIEQARPYDLELEMTAANGARKWVRTMGVPIVDGSKVVRLEGAIQDITLRKRALIALHERDELIQLLLASTAEAIYGINLAGSCTFANPACIRVLGFQGEEELLGKNMHELIHYARADGSPYPAHDCRALSALSTLEGVRVDNEVFWRRDGTSFPVEYLAHPLIRNDKIEGMVVAFTDITDRKAYEAQLERQANYDPLTGLANRSLLVDRMQQALKIATRNDQLVAVFMLDVDRFKLVNDSLGHPVGDQLLQHVAERLQEEVRAEDTVARFGGDEFMVILPGLASEREAVALAQRLLERVAQPVTLAEHEVIATVSIGAAIFPRDGSSVDVLMSNADLAMYRAKDRGRNSLQFYGPEMNARILERLDMEWHLRRAVESGEFELYYQPQVDLRSGRVIGAEALIRWHHPEFGLVPPCDFIPLAEETNLIVPIGAWVVDAACRQLKAWDEQGLGPLQVAVNVSARQFHEGNLAALVADALKKYGIAANCLEVELTESAVMHEPEKAIAMLRELKRIGVSISLDDFGTGYSSLSYLKRFPIDVLKIDQSFVRDVTTDPDDAAIALSVISLAHSLKRRVVAEGVETEAQLGLLRRNGCDSMQGFLFARPLPAEEFAQLLRSGQGLPAVATAGTEPEHTLLIVDDEPNVVNALRRLLRRDDYRVLTAASADQAMELLALHDVQVVLADQRMPQVSGTELLARVKEMYPDTVRIVLSGYTDLQTVTDSINQGAIFKFLTKPWDDDLLREHIREAFLYYDARLNKSADG